MGEYLWGTVDPQWVRMAAAFGGGVGGTHEEICGALSGGVMALGALWGPRFPKDNEDRLRQAIRRYRERFIAEIGPTQCGALRAEMYGPQGKEPCSVLVQRAIGILLAVMDESSGSMTNIPSSSSTVESH